MVPSVPQKPSYRYRAVLIVVCLAAIGGSAFYLWKHLQGGSHLEEARALAARYDLAGARAKLLEGLAFRPDHPDIHFELGRVCRRLGLEKEARTHWRRCEELGGVPELLRLERLLLRAQQGDMGGHEKELWAYVEKNVPDRNLFLEAMARGYLSTFRLGQAQHCLEKLLQEQPDHFEALAMLGQLLTRVKRTAEARAAYEKLVAVAPNDLAARTALGNVLNESNQPHLALEQFDHVLKNQSDAVEAAHGKARALAVQGKTAEARALLEDLAARKALRPEGTFLRGKVEMESAQPAAALPWLRRAVEATPFDREAVYTLALCLQRLNQEDEAKKWFARSKDIEALQRRLAKVTGRILEEPQNADLRFQAGEIFLDTKQDAEGLRWLFSALQEDPRHVPTHRRLSDYYRGIGRLDLAEYHGRQAGK